MGYRVHTLSPDQDTPTGQVADVEINAPYEDLDAVAKFASSGFRVTFEFENVPAATAAAAERNAPGSARGPCSAHDAAPAAREDISVPSRSSGYALPAG